MPTTSFTKEQEAAIAAEYAAGASIAQIAAKYGLLKKTMSRYMRKMGIAIRVGITPKMQLHLLPAADDIVAAYQDGTTIQDLAAMYGCDTYSIKKVIKGKGVELRKTWVRNTRSTRKICFDETEMKEIAELYLAGWTLAQIAEHFEVGTTAIHTQLAKAGVKTRSAGDAPEEGRIDRIRCEKYGITVDDYNAMFTKQLGCCAICGATVKSERNNSVDKLCIDHSHSGEQRVRGLLCNSCNQGLGMFTDNPDLLTKAVNYLQHNAGIIPKPVAPRNPWKAPITEAQKEAIIADLKTEKTMADIARDHNTTPTTVRRYALDLGLRVNKPHSVPATASAVAGETVHTALP